MLKVSKKVRSHVIGHMILAEVFSKSVQTTFFKSLINIFRRRWSCAKVINIKFKKIDNFSQGQKIGFICRLIKSNQKYYGIFSTIYLSAQVLVL